MFYRRLLLTALLTLPALPMTAAEVYAGQSLLLAKAVKQQKASSAAEAAKIAKQRYGGKVLKVETLRSGDGVQYRVKILLDDGRVRTVVVSG